MRTWALIAIGGASFVVACAKLADLEGSNGTVGTPAEGSGESPNHLAGDVVISPMALEFGPVNCGTKATAQTISIQNTTGEALPYEVKLPEGFVLEGPATGTIDPHGAVTIPIAVLPTSPNEIVGSVLISAGQSFVQVLAHAVGRGAVLEFVPNLVDFGQVRLGTSATPVAVELKNVGSAAATITAFEGKTTELGVSLVETLTIPPNESRSVTATFAAPGDPKPVEATVLPTVTSALCAQRPELKLRGNAIDTNVTLSVADFGTVDCNSPVTTTEVTISNYAPGPIELTGAELPASSRFEIETKLPISIEGSSSGSAPGTAKLTVRAKPVGVDLGTFEEKLTLTFTNVEPPNKRETTARIDVRGAILEVSPGRHDYWSNGWFTDWKRFTLTNKGNAPITVTYDVVRTAGPVAWAYVQDNKTIAPGKTAGMDLGFRSGSRVEHRATMTPRRLSGAAACTAMPVAEGRGVGQ